MYFACNINEIDGLMQGQLALYEQFLAALQGTVVAIKSSGATVTPQVMRKARTEFEARWSQTEEWMQRERNDFYQRMLMLLEVDGQANSPYVQDWLVPIELMIGRAMYLCKQANKRTFLSGLKFGMAFRGLSYLLDDMHGAVGHLVQSEATKITWNVRSTDGRTYSVYRYLAPYFRLFGLRAHALAVLLGHMQNEVELLEIRNKKGETLLIGKPEELLTPEVAEQYFNFGSENYIAVST